MNGLGKVFAASAIALALVPPAPAAAQGQSQAYPARPVRVIVPFAPGGGTDVNARQVSAKLSEQLGQPFVIDNRGGGGGLIGMETAAKAAPDGHSLLYSSASYVAAMAMRKASYDTLKTLIPVVEVARSPYVIAVHPSLPASMQGLLELARAKPGQIAYASTGVGGLTHLATELLLNMAKIQVTHVPYKGAGAALPDLLGGRTPVLMTTPISLMTHFQSGKLRPLAVTGSQRLPQLPEVPVATDSVPGYVVYTWYAVFAPGGTPRRIVDRLNVAANKILSEPEMRKNFEAQGIVASGGPPEQLGKLARGDYELWVKVVKENKITTE